MKKVFQVAAFAVFMVTLMTSAANLRGPEHFVLDEDTEKCIQLRALQAISKDDNNLPQSMYILVDANTNTPITVSNIPAPYTVATIETLVDNFPSRYICQKWIVNFE